MVKSATSPSSAKDIWDILQSVAHTVSIIAVPAVIALVAATYNERIKDSENRIRYVELAIAQLSLPPTQETIVLREWAVELLNSQSPVKLSSAAKAKLVSTIRLATCAITSGGTLVVNGSGSGGEAHGNQK